MVWLLVEYFMKVLIILELFLVLGFIGKVVYGKLIILLVNFIKEKVIE